jgi:photosystem II stability/assembly factor-like uncharacterized protein
VPRHSHSAIALLALSALALPATAQRWKVQYFYDKEKTSLTINDFAFPSAQYGIAVGYIAEGRREDPMSVLTSDGGDHWQLLPLKEMPISLFFLDDSIGWMVTTKGIWRTTEAGKNWTKLGKVPGEILRVCFTTPTDGVAVGVKKLVLTTHDGGQSWAPVPAAADQPGDPEYSAYVWVGFASPKLALVIGTNNPPRRFAPLFPDWLDPAATLRMRDVPHLSYSLSTSDGGKTWRAGSNSLLGQTSRFRFTPSGKGVGLVEYSELSELPSEVYLLDWHTGRSVSIYKDKKSGISDLWIDADGTVYLAGIEEPGRVRDIIPGKVVVYTSRDYQTWQSMPVDYRASALRTILAMPDDQHRWLATDNGMILKLVPDTAKSAR